MAEHPGIQVESGTSTLVLVLTDVEGSTRLWAEHPTQMAAVMGRHHEIVHGAVAACGGWRPVDQGEGDAVFAVFDSATAAVAAVARFQSALAAQTWPEGIEVRVRVGVHVGEVAVRGGNVFGQAVNRCARLRGLGAGGQVLLSAPAFELVRDRLPDGVGTTDLGEHRMKDLTRPEHIHQLDLPGLVQVFPPLAGLDQAQHNLPVQNSSFVGREQDVTDLVDLVGRERLVTITGFGGMGKTRLALQVAAELADGDGDGVWFIDLSTVTDVGRVPSEIANTLSISEGAQGALPSLLSGLRHKRLLLVVDNCEQLLPDVAGVIGAVLASAARVRLLVTSREALRLAGEQEYALAPLPLPPAKRAGTALSDVEAASLSTYAAVALFIARAAAVRRDFTLTASNAPAIAAICARLDGLPLALELAAARTRSLSPEALLPRLDSALTVLTGGNRDLPSRHRTLRATIAWSYDTLDPDHRQLLDRISVFPGTFTLDAAEAVCGPAVSDDDQPAGDEQADDLDVLDGVATLVERSLLRHHPASDSQPEDRYSLLVSIRDYATERLTAAGHVVALGDRHADYYGALIPPLPDWTPELRAHLTDVIETELHNYRSALERMQQVSDPTAEFRTVVPLCLGLGQLGMVGEARAATDHAFARTGPLTPDRVYITRLRAVVEFNAWRWDIALLWAERAVQEAQQLGEPSVLVSAIITALASARSRRGVPAGIAEVEELLAAMPSSGGHLPRWFLQTHWLRVQNCLMFTDPERVEAAEERLITQSGGDDAPDAVRSHEVLGWLLVLRGQFDAAEGHLARFEDPGAVLVGDPRDWVEGALDSALYRLVTGDLAQARADLLLAESRMSQVDVGDHVIVLGFRRAAVERAAGDPSAARTRLEQLLASAPDSSDPLLLAPSRWLLAVLLREAGEAADAARLLGQAWTATAGCDALVLDLVLECLLERAAQVSDDDPAEAVRLIGAVEANRGDFILTHGVTYDTAAMLTGLRARLGDDEVDAIVSTTTDQPLPDLPDWSVALLP